ncbi:MAG: T9SS type A sorting domain-containing protein [Flavobacteriales bacterium]|nr:T9SS type A sorting domain-containing protein [Flavobacteriales bacterium]
MPADLQNATVTIIDAMGRVILSDKSTTSTFVFDAGLFPPGVYAITSIATNGVRLTSTWIRS